MTSPAMPSYDAVDPQERGCFLALELAREDILRLESLDLTPEVEREMNKAITRLALACLAVADLWLAPTHRDTRGS